MTNILVIAAVVTLPLFATAQKTGAPARTNTAAVKKAVTETDDNAPVFVKVELEAHPNRIEWNKYLQKQTVLPDSFAATMEKGVYKVSVKFVIDVHGYIGQVEATNDPGYGLAQRAVRIIKNYPGQWSPANQCGRSVKSYQKHDITFVIE